MPQLKRRGRQEEHPIERAGQRAVADFQILIGLLALQLACERGLWVLQMVCLVKNQER
jgi:hypothetical protein